MNARSQKWTVRLSKAATADFRDILDWTEGEFGTEQALRYELVLTDAIDALTGGPRVAGSRSRSDLLAGLCILHVARKKHKGRHVLLYSPDNKLVRTIQILRILHDSMDFARHLPKEGGGAP